MSCSCSDESKQAHTKDAVRQWGIQWIQLFKGEKKNIEWVLNVKDLKFTRFFCANSET